MKKKLMNYLFLVFPEDRVRAVKQTPWKELASKSHF